MALGQQVVKLPIPLMDYHQLQRWVELLLLAVVVICVVVVYVCVCVWWGRGWGAGARGGLVGLLQNSAGRQQVVYGPN